MIRAAVLEDLKSALRIVIGLSLFVRLCLDTNQARTDGTQSQCIYMAFETRVLM